MTQRQPGITKMDASTLAEKVRQGELSSQEVTEAHIQRIEAVNQELNAVVIPLFEEARQQAKAADEKRARGEALGPLHGVPITIKEQYQVKGTQTTVGVTSHVGKNLDREGPLVTKLREAGAIILGKTNIMQTLVGWESDNPVYGRSNNPWDVSRSPGGSSGGEAAIIAAGGSPLGLAGDLGGSIRIPAHFCGVYGLMPTNRRLTNDDVPAELFSSGQDAITAQPGPIGRSVEDLDLMMKVLTGSPYTFTSDLTPPVPWPDYRQVSIKSLRVAMYTDNGFFPVSPAIRRAVEKASRVLQDAGCQVEGFTPPDMEEMLKYFTGIIGADGGLWLKHLLGDSQPIAQLKPNFMGMTMPNALRPLVSALMKAQGQEYVAAVIKNNGPVSAAKYWDLVKARNQYRTRFLGLLEQGNFDAIICPPCALPAFTHGSSEHLFPAGSYAFLYNLLGMPAGVVAATRVNENEQNDRKSGKDLSYQTAVAVDQNSAGLPVGVQVAARHWREDIVLAVMSTLEKVFRQTEDYPHTAPLA